MKKGLASSHAVAAPPLHLVHKAFEFEGGLSNRR
jgi:hypothetical protein